MINKIMRLLGYERLDKIIIPEEFEKNQPKSYKLLEREWYYVKFNKFKVPIEVNIINKKAYLEDGYTSYLIAKEYGLKYVKVKVGLKYETNK